jgi:lipopolysaccharide/colanic/teichoic acid biosynthesis glycosyltransferase
MKRLLDILISAIALLLLSPVLLIVAVLVRIKLGSPVLFRQERPGLNCELFTMFKFRTMISKTHDEQGAQLPDDQRLTRFGLWLRATSLDELPELLNVLKGELSLVGPRPPIGAEVAQYEPWQRDRLTVKPGLTCLWQVSGRSEIGFEDWIRMDVWYVKNQNLITDLKLLLQTPWSVLSRHGAY